MTQPPTVVTSDDLEPSPEPRLRGPILLAVTMIVLLGLGVFLRTVTDSQGSEPESGEVAVRQPGATDAFARADTASTLGPSDSGQRWQSMKGTWGIDGSQAYVAVPDPATASLATVGVEVTEGRAEVTAAVMAPGVGLAFRCRGPLFCWRVEAVPEVGTWNVIKVVQGEEFSVGNLGVVPVADGTTVAVEMQGPNLEFFVDGVSALQVEDPELAFETRAGLSLREPAGATTARWSNFSFTPRIGPGILDPSALTVTDDFDRGDADELGTTADGSDWVEVTGGWGVRDGQAALLDPAVDGDSIALVDLGASDAVVESTVIVPQQSTGLAFRCRDERNCWIVTATVGYGTWNITKVVDGDRVPAGDLGLVPNAPGTTLSITLRGSVITFTVNGEVARTIDDDFLERETRAGLVVSRGQFADQARWASFAAATEAAS